MIPQSSIPQGVQTGRVPSGRISPQAFQVLQHLKRTGSITAREAAFDLDITSATLSRRIVDLERAGHVIIRSRKQHPTTGKRYTRYVLRSA